MSQAEGIRLEVFKQIIECAASAARSADDAQNGMPFMAVLCLK
jgi:hypothetical protein